MTSSFGFGGVLLPLSSLPLDFFFIAFPLLPWSFGIMAKNTIH